MAKARRGPITGGSISRAPNGYLATVLTTGAAFPSPPVVQDIWSHAHQRLYPRVWDGVEPEGQVVIYWTPDPPIQLCCARCRSGLGQYRAYNARGEYGLVEETSRRYQPRESLPPGQRRSRGDRIEPARPRYRLAGDLMRAASAIAKFRCMKCGHECERNMRRLGKNLFEQRPDHLDVE